MTALIRCLEKVDGSSLWFQKGRPTIVSEISFEVLYK